MIDQHSQSEVEARPIVQVRLGDVERWADDEPNYRAALDWYAVFPWEVEHERDGEVVVRLFETEERAHAFATTVLKDKIGAPLS